ncbi:uncharacterized protein BDV14DRAFT_181189 [Aspergillus stella-maris]|uniref:uncharacterized protein n=1 Tax=Aspergillus stella-maris TaxID=1810926 RepID=UPI003CCDF70B
MNDVAIVSQGPISLVKNSPQIMAAYPLCRRCQWRSAPSAAIAPFGFVAATEQHRLVVPSASIVIKMFVGLIVATGPGSRVPSPYKHSVC